MVTAAVIEKCGASRATVPWTQTTGYCSWQLAMQSYSACAWRRLVRKSMGEAGRGTGKATSVTDLLAVASYIRKVSKACLRAQAYMMMCVL
jgi:hypothetical protein